MTLVTTPGASNADSYATLAAADAYFLARSIIAWTGIDAVKESALRRATTYLDNQYRDKWIGIRDSETQALAWPRVDGSRGPGGGFTYPLYDADGYAISSTAIPARIATATIELALLVIAGVTLEPTLTRGGAIKSISEQVGPLSTSITYVDGASIVDRYIAVEGLLRGLVTGTPGSSTGTVRLVRS